MRNGMKDAKFGNLYTIRALCLGGKKKTNRGQKKKKKTRTKLVKGKGRTMKGHILMKYICQ